MPAKHSNGSQRPEATFRINYMAPTLTEFGRVQDLTSAASGGGAGKFGNGQESSKSWQVRP